jgi:hypothetical protein
LRSTLADVPLDVPGSVSPIRDAQMSGLEGSAEMFRSVRALLVLTDAVEKVPNCLVTNFPLNDENGATAGRYAVRANTVVNG